MAAIPKLVFVGGFLGAGKTTLIVAAEKRLQTRGLRVGLILNDQDSELVDTRYAEAERFAAREVAGGCFCCRFSDLLERADELRAERPDIIFAEPVGSCIDLSATILQPLQLSHGDRFRVAPLTVLLDPHLAQEVLRGDAATEVAYLFQQQVREADIVCVTKADCFPEAVELPFPLDFQISARTGLGVDAWLEEALTGRRAAGARLLDVDYEEYAEAEAALGWLNVQATIRLDEPLSPAMVVGPLLDQLDRDLTTGDIRIAHLKVFDQARGGYVMASVRRNGDEPEPHGDLIGEPDVEHELAINLRALGDLVRMRDIVEGALSGIVGSVKLGHLRVFRPPTPKPEYRVMREKRVSQN
jgi:hypothetical protein